MSIKAQKVKSAYIRDTSVIAWIVLVIVALIYFCYVMRFSFVIPFFLLFIGIYLNYFKKAQIKILTKLGFLLTLLIFTTHILYQYSSVSPFYIPVAGICVLTMLLFNDIQLAFLMSFTSSLIVSMILGGQLSMMLTFFMGGVTGAFMVREARNRGTLLSAGVFISIVNVATTLLFHPDVKFLLTKNFLLTYGYPLLFNGFISIFLVIATLKIFEYLFSVVTNFSLLELADINQPLLKKMALEAPGTWQHSLVVGQLSEAAAEAIGVNGLLARAGAYYHDIGKLVKPEYFTENQLLGDNKHDNIEANLSRLVILSHVKEGIELAKFYKINPIIIDFIPQHHGTSLIHYFYQRALEDAKDGEDIKEEDYRYPGPKPQSKETAILLLADSVEGATRALEDPTPPRIEETVKRVINNKFIDGQLDESQLSLSEIEKISKAFFRILSALHHGRIKYPEKKVVKKDN